MKKIFKKLPIVLSTLFKANKRDLFNFILSIDNQVPKLSIKNSGENVFCGISNDHMFIHASENGINEPHFVELIKKIVPTSSTVLDIGSNIGTHAISLSRHLQFGQVIAFEPQSLTFSILQNNLLLNNCNNVHPLRFALGNPLTDEIIGMEPFSFIGEYVNNGVLSVSNTSGGMVNDYTIMKKLDSFDFKNVDFVKIDIQGSELNALKGGERFLFSNRPIIFIEIEQLHLMKFGTNSEELMNFLLSKNYTLYRIINDYPCDHICIPDESVENLEDKLADLSFELIKIKGNNVRLFFDSKNSNNYTNFEIESL
jgi:FkbM family methyltransferase